MIGKIEWNSGRDGDHVLVVIPNGMNANQECQSCPVPFVSDVPTFFSNCRQREVHGPLCSLPHHGSTFDLCQRRRRAFTFPQVY